MASKLISVREEVYNRLVALKGKEKSFSDVIMEFTPDKKNDLSGIIGIEPEYDVLEFEKSRKRKKGDDEREQLLLGH